MNPQNSLNQSANNPTQTGQPGGSPPAPQPNGGAQPIYQAPQPLSSQYYQPEKQVYAADYLDQIAPVQQKAANRMGVIGLIGGVLTLLTVVMFIINSLQPPSLSSTIVPLQARVETLQSITKEQNGRLGESTVSNANSSLYAVLTSMSSDLNTITADKKIKRSNDKKVKAAEASYGGDLTQGLELDYARGLLDRTYTTKMTYELTVLRAMLKKVLTSTQEKKIVEFVNAGITNIDTTLKILHDFDATKS